MGFNVLQETLPEQVLVTNPGNHKGCSRPLSTVQWVQSLFLKKAEFPKEDYFKVQALLSHQINLFLCSTPTELHSAHRGSPWKAKAACAPSTWGHPMASALVSVCPVQGRSSTPEATPYLQERFLLLQMLADHWGDVVCLGVGAQFVGPSTPVLFSLVLLLQALEDAADLRAESRRLRGATRHLTPQMASLGSVVSHALGIKVLAWGPRPSEGTVGPTSGEDKRRGQSRQVFQNKNKIKTEFPVSLWCFRL